MTPYELNLHIRCYAERAKRDGEESLALAYLSAYWQRVKRMPDLKKLLEETNPKPKKQQSDEAMLVQVKKMHAQLNGS